MLLVLAACAIAGCLYALHQNIPWNVALRALPAFLLETAFFYALARERVRARIEKLKPGAIALALTASAVAPYSALSLAFGNFHVRGFLEIAILAAVASFWYVWLPRKPASDLLFLAFFAVVWLARILQPLYPRPHPHLPLEVLAQTMWFRTGLFAMVSLRRPAGVGFGFWPRAREWRIGAVTYAVFLPLAAALNWRLGFAHFHDGRFLMPWTLFTALATFFGTLWVLALGEEFFFRGLLQQWMATWLGSAWAGLIGSALIYGIAHFWFRPFPNWKMALIATLHGVFCGLAFRRAGSIRAPMVTHALVVTTWRVFFSQ